jgi:hypothetical protein
VPLMPPAEGRSYRTEEGESSGEGQRRFTQGNTGLSKITALTAWVLSRTTLALLSRLT